MNGIDSRFALALILVMGDVRGGLVDLIGNTPLLRLRRVSEQTGCEILGKCEFLNPGSSVKDRAALFIIRDAETTRPVATGRLIVEGTAGNTGIGLALVGNALGYRTVIVMPETQSRRRSTCCACAAPRCAWCRRCPTRTPATTCAFPAASPRSWRAASPTAPIWANQFDNVANRQAHIETTGPEIWRQTDGKVDAFVAAVGTGGTLAGVGIALKERNAEVRDRPRRPDGRRALQLLRARRAARSEGSSITEGIGQGRITKNLEDAPIDDALRVSDAEALPVIFDLLVDEGLLLGGSSGINVAAAVKLARQLGPGHTIVTVLCDYGTRYQGKLFNPEFLRQRDLPVPAWL